MGSWGDKYRAILDGDGSSAATIDGSGFLVQSSNVEDNLRTYETDKYEVVRYQVTLVDTRQTFAAFVFKYVR